MYTLTSLKRFKPFVLYKIKAYFILTFRFPNDTETFLNVGHWSCCNIILASMHPFGNTSAYRWWEAKCHWFSLLKRSRVDLKNYFYSCQHIFSSFPSTAHSTIMPLWEWLVIVQTQGLLIYSFQCLLADKHLAAPIKSLGEFPSIRLEIQLRIPNMHNIHFFPCLKLVMRHRVDNSFLSSGGHCVGTGQSI